ncbi:MAG: peptide-methionine (S)-S-oxide reductase MsrA [Prolixibacteraceae bacterium]|nr:peptide-methionine (S)-S-oxide reductase MsrA [Prolixibacteraceae bacterium]MBN2649840.1 peptide-methionine (S)-S-oxide reductase MsrA [Prolixibacteraceae bacterium]
MKRLILLLFLILNYTDMKSNDVIVFGGGCFWCVEAVFDRIEGVKTVVPGYSGGNVINPSYREVCTGNTGHAEVVEITYNPQQVSLAGLLKVFFSTHDPTTLNRQGADVGTQYRSAIFYKTDKQKAIIDEVMAKLEAEHVYEKPIVTQVLPLENFYQAEAYHIDYYQNNSEQSYCRFVIQPKIEKFEQVFNDLLKK